MLTQTHLVLGLGEVGSALLAILRETYGEAVAGYDPLYNETGIYPDRAKDCHIIHIAFPFHELFVGQVQDYLGCQNRGALTIIHSTVPIGTTAQIPGAVHSPILGRVPTMAGDMRRYLKWIGGPQAAEAEPILALAGFRTRSVPTSEETEALKLLCLAKYGVSLAFSRYEYAVCEKLGFPLSHIIEYDMDYNNHVEPRLRRPLIAPQQDSIGGHCVIPGVRLLAQDFPSPLLTGILRYGQAAVRPLPATADLEDSW